jgi:NADH dehydrogenase
LAGALAEIANDTLSRDFRAINPAEAKILLLEGYDRVLPTYPPELSSKAEAALRRLGVTVRTGAIVTRIESGLVTVRTGDRHESIPVRTVLWAAGVQASPLGRVLASATGAPLDSFGRVGVRPDLSLQGHPEIFVIGDMAHVGDGTGTSLPGVAQVAMQQGRYVATLIRRRLLGQTMPAFRYRDYGSMATIGRAAAVADLSWIRISGYVAWLTWLLVHLVNLVEYENRVLVLVQWAWNYVTRNRSARLITGENPLPFRH